MRKKVIPWLVGLFALLFVFAGVMIVRELVGQQKTADEFDELAMLVAPEATPKPTGGNDRSPQQPEAGEQETQPVPAARNLQPLFERNGDCIGWICIEDTAVNYPVMHTPEKPETYLHKNFDKKYSAAGVPFLEGGCSKDCQNLIVYAHNMKNGTMFADVTKYRKKEFGTAHPVIQLETAEGLKKYTVFAVVRLQDSDDWYGFHHAADENEYNAMVEDLKDRSLYDLEATPRYGQQLLTLSTCYGSRKTDRIIVVGFETWE